MKASSGAWLNWAGPLVFVVDRFGCSGRQAVRRVAS